MEARWSLCCWRMRGPTFNASVVQQYENLYLWMNYGAHCLIHHQLVTAIGRPATNNQRQS